MIGSLWLPAEQRNELKQKINILRENHNTHGEIKWSKISPSRVAFYLGLVDLFFDYEDNLRFRCIAVDRTELNMSLHDNDGELGFYKFYYQLLHHWVLDFNEYRFFCDAKSNRDLSRLGILKRCLSKANLSATVSDVQFLPSHEVVLIQLCDMLLGAASSRINKTTGASTAKQAVLKQIEHRLGHPLAATVWSEKKFNIFKIRLQGGW